MIHNRPGSVKTRKLDGENCQLTLFGNDVGKTPQVDSGEKNGKLSGCTPVQFARVPLSLPLVSQIVFDAICDCNYSAEK